MEIDNKDSALTTEVKLSVRSKEKTQRKKLITNILLFKLNADDYDFDVEDDDDDVQMWENSCECTPRLSSENCKCVRQAEESLRKLERELSWVRKTSNKFKLSLPSLTKNRC